MNILVIDDDVNVAGSIGQFIRNQGHSSTEYNQSTEVVESLDDLDKYDHIILDIDLLRNGVGEGIPYEIETGEILYGMIREKYPEKNITMISNKNFEELVTDFSKEKNVTRVQKPIFYPKGYKQLARVLGIDKEEPDCSDFLARVKSKVPKKKTLLENEDTIFSTVLTLNFGKEEMGYEVESSSGRKFQMYEFADYYSILDAMYNADEPPFVTPHIILTHASAKSSAQYTKGRTDIKALAQSCLDVFDDPKGAYELKMKYLPEQIQAFSNAFEGVYPDGKIVIEDRHFIDADKDGLFSFEEQVEQDYGSNVFHGIIVPDFRTYLEYVVTLDELNRKHDNLYFTRYAKLNSYGLESESEAIVNSLEDTLPKKPKKKKPKRTPIRKTEPQENFLKRFFKKIGL
ncbi:response regulator [Candidatus Woesearchaeota archaeon]|nr:response regulator [Candidatus Woesearchaeota archaeon]